MRFVTGLSKTAICLLAACPVASAGTQTISGWGMRDPMVLAMPATVQPAPTNLAGFAFRRGFDDVVRLSWKDNSNNEDSFHLESCAGSTCTHFVEIKKTAPNVTSLIVGYEFKFGKTYKYRVRAHGPYGYSAYSNIRTITLP